MEILQWLTFIFGLTVGIGWFLCALMLNLALCSGPNLRPLAAIFGVREIVLTKHIVRDEALDETIQTLRDGDPVYVIGTADIRHDAPAHAAGADRLVIRPLGRSSWSTTLWRTTFGAINPPKGRDIHRGQYDTMMLARGGLL